MTRHYRYVGPAEIADRVVGGCGGIVVDCVEKLSDTLPTIDNNQSGGPLTVTSTLR